MKKNLKRKQILFYLDGFGVMHAGANPVMRGDCSGLWGDCSGLSGNCTGMSGDLDECGMSDDDRKIGIKIIDLVG